jgi:hypothetical protein
VKILLNYATAAFADAQKTCSETALSAGEFDLVRSFGPNDVDEKFRLEYRHIFNFSRGAGYCFGNLIAHQDVITFELPYVERQYTKHDAFVLMDCDSVLLFACDERILTDRRNTCDKPNYPGFRAHRHDQSILSLVAKRYWLPAFRDPSQFGNHNIGRYANSPYDQIIQHTRRSRSPLTEWLARVVP